MGTIPPITPADPPSGGETYRGVVEARLPHDAGGTRCTVIVFRETGHPRWVLLTVGGALRCTAILTGPQAVEVAGMLTAAAGSE